MRLGEPNPPRQPPRIPAHHPPRDFLRGTIIVIGHRAVETVRRRKSRFDMAPGDHRDDERRHADHDERPPQCKETSDSPRSPGCHSKNDSGGSVTHVLRDRERVSVGVFEPGHLVA